jgi:hypothetical protein
MVLFENGLRCGHLETYHVGETDVIHSFKVGSDMFQSGQSWE